MSNESPDPNVNVKRGAIVGTAQTWKNTPWGDQGLDVLSLNDAYVLGIPRASAWFDLHPIPEMTFRPVGERQVSIHHAPVGGYLRPANHLDWLRSQQFPVYLHDCAEAGCADLPAAKRTHQPYERPQWPNARSFPFKMLQERFGRYFSSTPAWMLAWMLTEQYRQIHIYGIHLATEWEYIHQRPNLEFLIGMALAQGVAFTIPDRSSLLKGKHLYAVEPKPNLDLERLEREAQLIKMRSNDLAKQRANLAWYQRGRRKDLERRLAVLDYELRDTRQGVHRLQSLAHLS